MDSVSAHFAKAFIACAASSRDIKRVYMKLALIHHPDKHGDKETFQKLEAVYEIAKKGRSGMTQLRRAIPKKVSLKAPESNPHADKLGVFARNAEIVNNKPLYVNQGEPKTAIWWAPPDLCYPIGMWLVGLYDKRGQDDAYHIRSARKDSLEEEKEDGAWETFLPRLTALKKRRFRSLSSPRRHPAHWCRRV